MIKKFKHLVFVSFLILFSCDDNNNANPIWYHKGLESAMLELKPNQLLMIDFYTDWWRSCKLLDANTLSNSDFQKVAKENLICIKINRNTNQGKKLYNQYNGTSLPYLIFLDKNLKLVGAQSGFINAIELNNKIQKLIAEL